jgi:hypothetical protein
LRFHIREIPILPRPARSKQLFQTSVSINCNIVTKRVKTKKLEFPWTWPKCWRTPDRDIIRASDLGAQP